MTGPARTWVDGPAGGTPINAARLNGMETDIAASKDRATSAADFGTLDLTGSTDMSTVLQAAFNATPDGGTLIIPPGTYRVNTTIVSTGKSIHVYARGAKFVYYGATGVAVQIIGSWDTTYPVTGVAASTQTLDGNTVATLNITVTGTPSYAVGDVIKLVADDAIPGTRPASGGLVARVGQFLVVQSIAGSVVTCISNGLIDPFTTNIRVAKLNPNTCTIDGLTATVQPYGLLTSVAGLIQVSQLINPTLTHVTIGQSGGQAINPVSCYGYEIRDCTIGYANNDSASGIYGYGIADNASSYGRVTGLNARDVRHSYTTNTNQIATNSSLYGYGRTYGSVISDSVAHGTSGASFDVHSDAQAVRFVNCAAYDSGVGAFSLRGRKNSVIDCRAIRPNIGLYVFSESGMDTDSWGHTIDGLVIDNPVADAIKFYLNQSSNVIDTRPSTIGNVKVINAAATSISFTNATVRAGTLDVTTANFTNNADRLITTNRAYVSIDTLRLDMSAQTSAVTGLLTANMVNNSTLKIGAMKLTTGAQSVADMFAYMVDTSNATPGNVSNILQVDMAVLDYYKAATYLIPWADSSGDTYVNYRVIRSTGGGSSTYVYFSNSATSTPPHQLSRTTDRAVTMAGTISSALNMPTLRGGRFAGQTVTITNLNGTGTLTVRNGSTYGVTTKSGTDTALAPGAYMVLTWDGTTWRQII